MNYKCFACNGEGPMRTETVEAVLDWLSACSQVLDTMTAWFPNPWEV